MTTTLQVATIAKCPEDAARSLASHPSPATRSPVARAEFGCPRRAPCPSPAWVAISCTIVDGILDWVPVPGLVRVGVQDLCWSKDPCLRFDSGLRLSGFVLWLARLAHARGQACLDLHDRDGRQDLQGDEFGWAGAGDGFQGGHWIADSAG